MAGRIRRASFDGRPGRRRQPQPSPISQNLSRAHRPEPKAFSRVLRFRQAAKYANGQRRDWADIAVASGYYDQAHLINEFKKLAGVSPAQFSSLTVASHFRSESTL